MREPETAHALMSMPTADETDGNRVLNDLHFFARTDRQAESNLQRGGDYESVRPAAANF